MLNYTSYVLQVNKEVVLAAVTQNGLALKYASEALRDDTEIVIAAVQQNMDALECAHKSPENSMAYRVPFKLDGFD